MRFGLNKSFIKYCAKEKAMPKRKQRTMRMHYVLLLLLLALFAGINVGGYFSVPSIIGSASQYAVGTAGYVPVRISVQGSELIMASDCYTLRVTVSDVQALSIANGLEKRIDTRPLTHDIMKDIFDNYDFKVLAARVNYFQDGIYYGDLVMQQGNKVLSIDARPSDAIAIAVRYDVPVHFNESLLMQQGTKTC